MLQSYTQITVQEHGICQENYILVNCGCTVYVVHDDVMHTLGQLREGSLKGLAVPH